MSLRCVALLMAILSGATAAPAGEGGHAEQAAATKKKDAAPRKHKLGPFDLSVNWRARAEGWDWFQGRAGENAYGFGDSLLRIGIGQHRDRFDWFLEASAPVLLGLPTNAVVAGAEGQLGLGGTYYAANGSHSNNASIFAKQAYIRLKLPGSTHAEAGRFEYFDGLEITSSDALLATVVRTRIASRLISNFDFSTVQRSFDGAQFSRDFGDNNVTLLAARPTAGVFQTDGMGDLDVDLYYGAFSKAYTYGGGAGQFRAFSLGYIDHRTTLLKTDNRPPSARTADSGRIEIATTGADYAHVVHSRHSGNFDFLVWGAIQTGSWGALEQRAGAFVGEIGWQAEVRAMKPWISAGYSYGSGDGNPNDRYHGTFFQVLPTPRQYARFPFYNMMNNEDAYVTLSLEPAKRLAVRSEGHDLWLANSSDLWYLGGGAFQRGSFGYTGRPSNGRRKLADVGDVSATYEFTRGFSATAYFGHAWGGSAVGSIYPVEPNGNFAYVETDLRF